MRSVFLPYCRPSIDHADICAVVDAMNRGWLTTGPKAAEFEVAFAKEANVKHAIALNSCTAGLHLAMIAAGVRAGDEVVMPSLSFVAAAQCALHLGATPRFCDVDPETLCASVDTIEAVTTSRTRLIVTMGYAGRPADIEAIIRFAAALEIPVLEDAALNAGTLDRGYWAGRWSMAAVYSFYATKNLMTAEGGMLLTNDDELAAKVRTLALHGMTRDAWKRYRQGGSWRYDVIAEGHKYNMPDIAAAMGITQLARLEAMQLRRTVLARTYLLALQDLPGIVPAALGKMRADDRHSWAFFPVLVDKGRAHVCRNEFIELLASENIGTSVHYIPTHLFAAFSNYHDSHLPVTNAIWEQLVSLPLFPSMSSTDINDVIIALTRVLSRSRSIAVS